MQSTRLYLINPSNPLVSSVSVSESRWNRYRVWKPLSLMVLAGLTPPEWGITIVDENLGAPDYHSMSRPHLVGITAFTSQANRAYQVAAHFRSLGVPVVMGGIHATMCLNEVMGRVDSVVTGEAESIWIQVLHDARRGALRPHYEGGHADFNHFAPARHDLLPGRYAFGAIQTTRGCPLNCNFCSVTSFNGAQYRQRPVADVVREFQAIPEKRVLVVDDNLVGTRPEHVARAKELFRALAQANLHKQWIAQATINFADDDELLVKPHDLYFNETRLIPSYSCGPDETRRALSIVERGVINASELVTHRFPLAQITEAFATAQKPESLKVIVTFAS